jgi:excisionase family DNA binding protein
MNTCGSEDPQVQGQVVPRVPPGGPSRSCALEAERLYSVLALAELWSVSKHYVYREIAAGRLAAVQLGRGDRSKLRIPASAAERWLRERQAASTVGMAW